jgi:L-seryl-tRNA(Ser) seleniumtransferase
MEMRELPSVDALATEAIKAAGESALPNAVVLQIARSVIDEARAALLEGDEPDDLVWTATQRIAAVQSAVPTPVVNATGVLLHTNLGRAPMPAQAAKAAADIAVGASNVELDLRTGRRSRRRRYVSQLLPVITGAEAGIAVNNNAGALLLALASVAGSGGRVAVSRGELIEIGGSFRLPSLMEASGATLVEVGTTNRTRLSDFEAVADGVDAILKVHPSNYRIDGFAEEASYDDLADLAKNHDIPFIADVGSGLIDATAPWLGDADRSWLRLEPGVIQTIQAGADLVLFSGDKLLGGPQAGVLVGTKTAVERAAHHPIARAVRLDGQTIASLCTVLEMYADANVLDIPFWNMASTPLQTLIERAESIVDAFGPTVTVVKSEAVPGAGSVPGETIPSIALRLDGNPDAVWQALASNTPPVIAVRRDDAVYLDLRSVDPAQDEAVVRAISAVIG